MTGKKILVYGAGPLGSLFAARLHEGGNEVSLLARGQKLANLREHGIVLRDFYTKQETVTRVNIVEELAPDDAYDLVLVIMRKNHALKILPVLAANQHTPNVLFLMNNAAGPGELVEALGKERVLIGFPGSAGYFEGYVIHCLTGTEDDQATVPFGEVDGCVTEGARQVACILDSALGAGKAYLLRTNGISERSEQPQRYATRITRHGSASSGTPVARRLQNSW